MNSCDRAGNEHTKHNPPDAGVARDRMPQPGGRQRYIVGTAWSTKGYMNMRPFYQPQLMQTEAVA
jgi:hypothetical protein